MFTRLIHSLFVILIEMELLIKANNFVLILLMITKVTFVHNFLHDCAVMVALGDSILILYLKIIMLNFFRFKLLRHFLVFIHFRIYRV